MALCQLNSYGPQYAIATGHAAGDAYYLRLIPHTDQPISAVVPYVLSVPDVVLRPGVLRRTFEINILYLLQYTPDDLLYYFRLRNGLENHPGQVWGWDSWLQGSVSEFNLPDRHARGMGDFYGVFYTRRGQHGNSSTSLAGVPGSFLHVFRAWETGDYIRYSSPYGFSVTKYVGLSTIQPFERYAYEIGPVLLAAVGTWDPEAQSVVLLGLDPMSPDTWMEAVEGASLHFRVKGRDDVVFMPVL